MTANVVGKVPEFTDETPSVEPGTEEVKEAAAEEVVEKEKETPSELPAEEKPAGEEPGVDTGELLSQVQGLQEKREKLLKEIQELRGSRREIKHEELSKVETKLDELKDLHPEDISVVDRILRSKGYITKEETQRMYYIS